MTKEQNEEPIVDVESAIDKSSEFVDKNKKTLSNVGVALIAVALAFFAYNKFVAEPAALESQEEMAKTEQLFLQDSLLTSLTGKEDILGFEDIASEFGRTPAGNLANLYAGLVLLHDKKFDEALDKFNSFDAEGHIFPHIKKGLIADCKSELGETDKAIDLYVSTAKKADDLFLSPYYFSKAAILLENDKEYDEAIKIYETIKKEYYNKPDHLQDKEKIEKRLGRVKAKKTLENLK